MGPKKLSKGAEKFNEKLALTMKSGKCVLGFKQTMKALRAGKAKLLVLANNVPHLRKSEIEYLAMLGKTGVHHFHGNNTDLGLACGKFFRVTTMAITDEGDSDILKGAANERKEK